MKQIMQINITWLKIPTITITKTQKQKFFNCSLFLWEILEIPLNY